jgi:hypothetical protein
VRAVERKRWKGLVVPDQEDDGNVWTDWSSWRDTADWLANRFGLEPHPGWQDYPLEVSDSARVEEFVQAYELEQLNSAQQLMLMELILYSLDELVPSLPDESSANILQRIRTLLEQDWQIHARLVRYWALIDDQDTIGGFCITPFAQEIRSKQGGLPHKNQP